MNGFEAVVLYRRKCPARFDSKKFAAKFSVDAWKKAIALFDHSKIIHITSFHIVFGPEQIEVKAEETGVPLKSGAKPSYYWARITTVVLSERDLPKNLSRGTNGKLQHVWI